MITVLELYAERPATRGGVNTYMQALRQLFVDDEEIKVLPIEYMPIRELPFLKFAYPLGVLDEAIKKHNPDWIHINGYTAIGTFQSFLSAIRYKKKILYTAHWHPFSQLRRPWAGKLFFNTFLKPLIRKYANAVITINNEDSSFFRIITPHVYQIPHWYSTIPSLTQEVEKKRNMILFVGRIEDPVKGIEHLYHIPKGEFEIHCVGSGNIKDREDIFQHTNISNEKLTELYQKASLLVVPSKYEAFSYVALEALLLGTPVLASDRVRIGDYLKDVQGFDVFSYGNYKEFVNKISLNVNKTVDVKKVMDRFCPTFIKRKYKEVILTHN